MNKIRAVLIVIGVVIVVAVGVFVVQRFSPQEQDQVQVPQTQKFDSQISDLEKQGEVLQLGLNQSAGGRTIFLDNKYDMLVTRQLKSGRLVLEVPLPELDTPYYADLITKVPSLTAFRANNPLFNRQTVFYNPSSQTYTLAEKPTLFINEFELENKLYWIYEQDGGFYVSEPNFLNQRNIILPSSYTGYDITDIKQISPTDPVFWVKVRNRINVQGYTTFDLIKYDLSKILSAQDGQVGYFSLVNFVQEIIFIDQEFERSYAATLGLQSSLIQGVLGESVQNQGSDYLLDLYFQFQPLKNDRLFYNSHYYTSNFWVQNGADSRSRPQRITNYSEAYSAAVFSTCAYEQGVCFVYNAKTNNLAKFNTSGSDIKIEQGKPTLINTTIDDKGIASTLKSAGYERDKLFRYEPSTGELRFWYGEKWLILGKN